MDMFKMMKEAMAMKSRLAELEKELKAKVVEVEDCGVKVKINGKSEVIELNISDDAYKMGREKLEKAVTAAIVKAVKRSQEMMAEEAKKITGGMKIPGLT